MCGQRCTQTQQRTPDMGFDGSEGQACMLSDLVVGQATEEDQCDELARHRVKGRQCSVHPGAVLAGRQEVGRVAAILGFDLQQGMRLGVAQGRVGPAQMVEGTAAGNGPILSAARQCFTWNIACP